MDFLNKNKYLAKKRTKLIITHLFWFNATFMTINLTVFGAIYDFWPKINYLMGME